VITDQPPLNNGPAYVPGWAGGMSRDQPPSQYWPASVPGCVGWAGHVISLLLNTAWAVFYTWLGRVGWSRDQPPTNYGMGRLLYLAGPRGLVT
jgi:hypothetical protein